MSFVLYDIQGLFETQEENEEIKKQEYNEKKLKIK